MHPIIGLGILAAGAWAWMTRKKESTPHDPAPHMPAVIPPLPPKGPAAPAGYKPPAPAPVTLPAVPPPAWKNAIPQGLVPDSATIAAHVATLPADLTHVKAMKAKQIVIKKGDKGPTVLRWQISIGEKTSGVFDEETDFMTKEFQKAHGLTADGIVGPATWGKIK